MISMHIPTGSQAPDLNKELMSAKNIKDRATRQSTIQGI